YHLGNSTYTYVLFDEFARGSPEESASRQDARYCGKGG
ncbi:MAG: hypothetical protein QOH33_885, partial [Paraburkholderia sp.]|nr:hypothetical protein [Paraburkholderia sp.]